MTACPSFEVLSKDGLGPTNRRMWNWWMDSVNGWRKFKNRLDELKKELRRRKDYLQKDYLQDQGSEAALQPPPRKHTRRPSGGSPKTLSGVPISVPDGSRLRAVPGGKVQPLGRAWSLQGSL